MANSNCMDCRDELNLCKLCVKKAWIKWLHADYISTESLCLSSLKAKQLQAEDVIMNNLCLSVGLKAKKVEAESLNANSLCAQSGVINTLCVNNLTANNLNSFVKYRAFVAFSANSNYILGANVDFDSIQDDPNNNISLAPFFYTVPVAGYYAVTLQVDQVNLVTSDPLLGVPTAHLKIYVNNVLARDATVPFLTFSNQQKSNIGSLLILNAGDKVQAQYSVDQLSNSGLSPVNGSVTIEGGPNATLFGIHFLSALANSGSVPCSPCPAVQTPCSAVIVDCDRDSSECPPASSSARSLNRNYMNDCSSC